jgi:hypothetical protein
MNTLDLGNVIGDSNKKQFNHILDAYENKLNSLLSDLRASLPDDHAKARAIASMLREHCLIVEAQKLAQACKLLIESPDINNGAVYTINVEAQRLKNEIKYRKCFMSLNNQEKSIGINILKSHLMPSLQHMDAYEYPSEIMLNNKEKESLDFNLNPLMLYQSLQFKRLPSEQVPVKKSVCRCLIL